MATFNKVILIGRLTDNPEPPRVLPNSGSTVVKFRFAVSKNSKKNAQGGWENDPNPLYIDCEAFSKPEFPGLTNVITQWCTKGKEIMIEGRLQYDTWDDKNNPGQKRSKHKVVVEAVQLLGGGGGGGGEGGGGGGGGGGGNYGGGGGGGGGGNYGGGGGGGGYQQRPQQPQGGGNYGSPPPQQDNAPDHHDEGGGDIPF
jgi:single-strand DNA-binding protein